MQSLRIIHWNCFKLTNVRSEELRLFLQEAKPDIMSVQETKLNNECANLRMRYKGYSMYHRQRPTNPSKGGGVAILVKEEIKHSLIECHNLTGEFIAINVEHGKTIFNFVTLYNPPNVVLDKNIIINLINKEEELILVGDINACAESLGCKRNNDSGRVLEELLLEEEITVCNDSSPTYFTFKPENGYSEILDLVIASTNFSNRVNRFQVLADYTMGSDHCPISCYLKLNDKPQIPVLKPKTRLDLGKADWNKFQTYLTGRSLNYNDLYEKELTPQILNNRLATDILKAAEISIPISKARTGKELPENIVHLIKQRKAIAKNLKVSSNANLRQSYNQISSEIRKKISEFKEKTWTEFLEKNGSHPVAARPFWKEINKAKEQKNSNIFPNLRYENVSATTDKQKADLFASILKQTFSHSYQENDFDSVHKAKEEKKIEETNFDEHGRFTMFEINKVLRRLKPSYSPGEDQIPNIFLKKLPVSFVEILLRLCNLAYNVGLPKEWRLAKITMIPKTAGKSKEPSDYRPISMTSCVGKLAERLIKARLYSHLENNNLIVTQQSGFRNERGAADNLFTFTQKIAEKLATGNEAVGIFFDISKAFDRVWHKGLVSKMISMNIPLYLVRYIIQFLSGRESFVRINDEGSETFAIECGLPQGSVLAPTLFAIYINDIPLALE